MDWSICCSDYNHPDRCIALTVPPPPAAAVSSSGKKGASTCVRSGVTPTSRIGSSSPTGCTGGGRQANSCGRRSIESSAVPRSFPRLRELAHSVKGMLVNVSASAGGLASELEDAAVERHVEGAQTALAGLSALVPVLMQNLDEVSFEDLLAAAGASLRADAQASDVMTVPRSRPGRRGARPVGRASRASPSRSRCHRRGLPSRDRGRA